MDPNTRYDVVGDAAMPDGGATISAADGMQAVAQTRKEVA